MATVSKIHPSSKRKPIRIHAVGCLSGWFYRISDGRRRLLASDFGALPGNFKFNPDTATLFALAQASRAIDRHFAGSRVVMICTASRQQSERREQRWAA
jgi:hypothetical protein